MRKRLELIAAIYLRSPRTQWAFYLGVIAFFLITLLGQKMVGSINVEGNFGPLMANVAGIFSQKYDKLAITTLAVFWWTAYKCFQHDKKRLLSI